MATIAQRDLRNESGDILRRVEAGEHFVVTRAGKPVAELIPVRHPQRTVDGTRLNALLARHDTDDAGLEDLRALPARLGDGAPVAP